VSESLTPEVAAAIPSIVERILREFVAVPPERGPC
jgi:hypothetical protein